jgi:hypothetical protein
MSRTDHRCQRWQHGLISVDDSGPKSNHDRLGEHIHSSRVPDRNPGCCPGPGVPEACNLGEASPQTHKSQSLEFQETSGSSCASSRRWGGIVEFGLWPGRMLGVRFPWRRTLRQLETSMWRSGPGSTANAKKLLYEAPQKVSGPEVLGGEPDSPGAGRLPN